MQRINDLQYLVSQHPTLFIFIIVWTISWKGFALWKAGTNKKPVWFVVLLLVNTVGLLEIIYLFAVKDKNEKSETLPEEVKAEMPAETKVETPMTEVKIEETHTEEIKQETNQ